MDGFTATLTYLFAVGTVLLGLLLLVTVITRLSTGAWLPPSVDTKVRTHALTGAAVLSVFAALMSFWYSEVVGFAPCVLCWFARTMMFPLAIVTLIAAWRRDYRVWPYALALSAVGMVITGYHHLYQMGVVAGTFCNALEGGGDCAKRYVLEFDVVTMPLMGFVAFATVALLVWLARKPE